MYRLVFDASQKPPDLWFAAFGLIFVVVGAGLFIWARRWPLPERWARHPRYLRGFSYVFLGFSILWTSAAFASVLIFWHVAQDTLSSGRAHVVVGDVENFHPMPYDGHDEEHFTVAGVYFAYSDYSITPGFKTTSSHGGPVREGLAVRVAYTFLQSGNTILRLEIRSQ